MRLLQIKIEVIKLPDDPEHDFLEVQEPEKSLSPCTVNLDRVESCYENVDGDTNFVTFSGDCYTAVGMDYIDFMAAWVGKKETDIA